MFPADLDQLIPQYVADEGSLLCPIVLRDFGGGGNDPGIGVYEYQLEGVPKGPGAAKVHLESLARRREYLLQSSNSSDALSLWPVIRCPVEHSRLASAGEVLNIDVDGNFFLSPKVWEERLEHETELSRFFTLDLGQGVVSDRAHEFRSQGLALGAESLNLTAYCNVTERSSWFSGAISEFLGSLVESTLPEKGEFLSARRVPYYVENIIQLDRPPNNFHTDSMVGIPVKRRARAVHFLVGGFFRSAGVDKGWGVSVKNLVTSEIESEGFDLEIVIHFEGEDSVSHVERVRRGDDFRCFFEVTERAVNTRIREESIPSWSSGIDWEQDFDGLFVDEWRDRTVHDSLYTVTVNNECPDRTIDSVDLIAPHTLDGGSVVKPFVVAITLE